MNLYIYDDKKSKTEIIEIDDSKIENNPDLEFFNDNDIRKVWHSDEEDWYLSVVDVIRFLTDTTIRNSISKNAGCKKCADVMKNSSPRGVPFVPLFKSNTPRQSPNVCSQPQSTIIFLPVYPAGIHIRAGSRAIRENQRQYASPGILRAFYIFLLPGDQTIGREYLACQRAPIVRKVSPYSLYLPNQ